MKNRSDMTSRALHLHAFPDAETLAEALAVRVAASLREALTARGQASLAVSGGTTPKRFLRALAPDVMRVQRAQHVRAVVGEADRLLRHVDTAVKLYERLTPAPAA